MTMNDAVIAVFADHAEADTAVKKLAAAGFALHDLSVVGKGYHTEEKAVGFYNMGDRMRFWGTRGAFWGGLWGLFVGGLFLTIPLVGHVIVLGYLAATAVSVVEGAAVAGGLGVVGAAFASLGLPHDSVVKYEAEIKADGFLVMAHGSAAEMARARDVLATAHPTSLTLHALTADAPVRVSA